MSSFWRWILVSKSRCPCHLARFSASRERSSSISLVSAATRSSSFSRRIASRSISSCRIRRSRLSISSGTEFISNRSRDAASSIRSIALSGRKREVMYRCDNSTAATIASSLMRTWWWFSRALSCSKYFWNSSSVVAPIVRSSPRARAGLRMLAASIAPDDLPAPTSVCISSMKSRISPSEAITSCTTAFRRSSNSP